MKFDDGLLQGILDSDTARTWKDEISAVFFDSEAKRERIGLIRTELAQAQQFAGLADQEKEAAIGMIIGRLAAEASVEAKDPRREDSAEQGDAGTDRGDLEDTIIGRYPHPIASSYRGMTEARSAAAQFGCLLVTYEALVHYLAMVAISAYLRAGCGNPELSQRILNRLLKGRWGPGDYIDLLREIIRQAGDCQGHLPFPELPAFLFGNGKVTAHLRVLEAFCTLRNKSWAHGTSRDDEFFSTVYPPNRPRLDHELAAMPWLATQDFIRPTEIDSSVPRLLKADILMGERRKPQREYPLPLRTDDLAENDGQLRVEKSVMLANRDTGEYLPLFPLSLYHFYLSETTRGEGVFFLQNPHFHLASDARPILRKAEYVAYQSEQAPLYEEGRNDFATSMLERQAQRLREDVGEDAIKALASARDASDDSDPDCELTEPRQEQAYHLRSFVGRESELENVCGWVERAEPGGYLLITAPPGQGKSAFMARLAQRESEDGRSGCLLHMIKGHRDPLRFVPSLISQAARLSGRQFGANAYKGSVEDLRDSFLKATEILRAVTGRCMVLIDALDELEDTSSRVDFLPAQLPEGVRVVLSCRPDVPLVNELRTRLRGLDELELPALSAADFQLLVERRLEAAAVARLRERIDWHALFERLKGSPLFIRRALAEIERRLQKALDGREPPPDFSVDDFAASFESLFQDIYDEIGEKEGGRFRSEEGRQKARLLQFLSVAREPLGLEELQGLMRADGRAGFTLEDSRDRVFEMSEFLIDVGGNRFKPWHEKLGEFVRTSILGSQGCRELDEMFCHWIEQSPVRDSGYLQRNRVSHLVGAERFDVALAFLCDLHFIQQRCENGDAYGLAADYRMVWDHLPEFQTERDEEDHAKEQRRHYAVNLAKSFRNCKLGGEAVLLTPPSCRITSDTERVAKMDSLSVRITLFLSFMNFYNACIHGLAMLPGETVSLAWNYSEGGVIAESAANIMKEYSRPWLSRSPRPPESPPITLFAGAIPSRESSVSAMALTIEGTYAVFASDNVLHVWDVKTHQSLRLLTGHTQHVVGVALTADGRLAVSASYDATVRIWDVTTGDCLRVLSKHTKPISAIALSSDGNHILSSSWDGMLRVWEIGSGECLNVLPSHQQAVQALALSHNGRLAISGGKDKNLRISDVVSGECLRELCGHEESISDVALTLDGRRLVSASHDKTLRVWDLDSGNCQLVLSGHEGSVRAVSLTHDGLRAISGSWDGTLCVWDMQSGRRIRVLHWHGNSVDHLAITADGRFAALACFTEGVCFWDLERGESTQVLCGHREWISGIALTGDASYAISASGDKTLSVWDVANGKRLRVLSGHSARVSGVAVSSNSHLAVSCSRDKTVRLWDLNRGKCLSVLSGHEDSVNGIALIAEGNYAISASEDKTLRLWDLKSSECVGLLLGHEGAVTDVATASDANYAVSASKDATLRIWDLQRRQCVWKLIGHERTVTAVALARDGRCAVSASVDKTLRVWDLQSYRCLRVLGGHKGPIEGVAITADGRHAISASDDGTIRLWDLRNGQCLAIYFAGCEVFCVTMSLSLDRVVCGTRDGQLHFLRLRNLQLIREERG